MQSTLNIYSKSVVLGTNKRVKLNFKLTKVIEDRKDIRSIKPKNSTEILRNRKSRCGMVSG